MASTQLTATVIPGDTLAEDELLTTAKINAMARPVVDIAGSIDGSTVAIGPNVVTTSTIADGAVTADKLASDAVAEILAANQVETDQIADQAVTTAKIADGAVTAGKISGLSVAGPALNVDASAPVAADTLLLRQTSPKNLVEGTLGAILGAAATRTLDGTEKILAVKSGVAYQGTVPDLLAALLAAGTTIAAAALPAERGTQTYAHTLARMPYSARVVLVCQSGGDAGPGYAENDEVAIEAFSAYHNTSGQPTSFPLFACRWTTAALVVSSSDNGYVQPKTGALDPQRIDRSKWKLKAYLL